MNTTFFDGLPSELPVNSQRYLECQREGNISPVSALTTASYLYDMGGGFDEDDEDDENGPRKALHNAPFAKRLPMEENFDSDDEDDTNPENNFVSPKKLKSRVTKSTSKSPRKLLKVENQVVHDKYGDGGMYTGQISASDRLPHGFGKMEYDNGRYFAGNWKGGRWHGNGKWVNPNGDSYEGNFVYDAREGKGVYRWKNGNVYSGDFKEDKREGKGTFNFANGNVYTGDFVNGIFEGKGKYKFQDGWYEGEWASGRYHGEGFLCFSDGSSYRGGFVNGVAHGKGEETSANGSVRRGIWENGRPKMEMEAS
mmetsp:Transcript_9020/g.14473  ORF Transcript_9020/g.14473 Transcript_9020/m.14473 type:complete len:310 (+) Transcript_9020:3-932(+)